MKTSRSVPPSQMVASPLARVGNQMHEFWEALRNTPEAFRLVWSASRRAALVAGGLMLVAAILPAAQAWAGKLIIDSIVDATRLFHNPSMPSVHFALLAAARQNPAC